MNTFSACRALWLVASIFVLAGCQTTQSDRFDQVDANRDRKLSLDEANTYLVSAIFEGRDTNRDHLLSADEWLVGDDVGARKEFRLRDANRDGVVSKEEALAYGSKQGLAAELVREADKDKDGQLSRPEVMAYYASKEGSLR